MEQYLLKIKNLCRTQPDLAIFGIFVFLLPFGTRRFITVLLPYSDQVFNFWSAAFVYLSDILLVSCLVVWFIRVVRRRFVGSNQFRVSWFVMALFTVVLIISTVINPELQLSWYGVARWIDVFLLCGYVL